MRMHRDRQGQADLDQLLVYYAWNEKAYPADAMRMIFVSNHDKNAWDGTESSSSARRGRRRLCSRW